MKLIIIYEDLTPAIMEYLVYWHTKRKSKTIESTFEKVDEDTIITVRKKCS